MLQCVEPGLGTWAIEKFFAKLNRRAAIPECVKRYVRLTDSIRGRTEETQRPTRFKGHARDAFLLFSVDHTKTGVHSGQGCTGACGVAMESMLGPIRADLVFFEIDDQLRGSVWEDAL